MVLLAHAVADSRRIHSVPPPEPVRQEKRGNPMFRPMLTTMSVVLIVITSVALSTLAGAASIALV